MGKYSIAFSIQVEHQFYSDGICPDLVFVPADCSTAFIDKNGLLIRNIPGGICVYYDEDRLENLKLCLDETGGQLNFYFKVFSNDQYFKTCSDLPELSASGFIIYQNTGEQTSNRTPQGVNGQTLLLEQTSGTVDSPPFAEIFNRTDQLMKPAFLVNIDFSNKINPLFNKSGQIPARAFKVTVPARKTIWKYFLTSDLGAADLFVLDVDNEIKFEYVGDEILPNRKAAKIFKSCKQVRLQQNSPRRIQLKKGGVDGKILLRRMPVPSVSQISSETNGGERITISEMYINL